MYRQRKRLLHGAPGEGMSEQKPTPVSLWPQDPNDDLARLETSPQPLQPVSVYLQPMHAQGEMHSRRLVCRVLNLLAFANMGLRQGG